MKPVFLLSVQLSVFFATALLSVWLMTRTTPAVRRLYGVTRMWSQSQQRPARVSHDLQEAAFRILHRFFGRMGMTVNDKLRSRFQAAGLRTQSSIDGYFAARVLGPVAVLVIWTFFRQLSFFAITLMAAGAYLGPDLWLTARIKRRREQMRLGCRTRWI